MTDMRATERLLEVIEDSVRTVGFEEEIHGFGSDAVVKALKELHLAVHELRRRGDTLVRAEDLSEAVEATKAYASEYGPEGRGGDLRPVIERLENALGGRMR